MDFDVAIVIPRFLGVVVIKNDCTMSFIDSERAIQPVWAGTADVEVNEDEYLAGFSVAMNADDLSIAIERLQRDGAVQGVDFVVTSSLTGVVGNMPDWLKIDDGELIDPDNSENRYKLLSYCPH